MFSPLGGVNNGTLTPVPAGQSPAIGPFGSSTRVTPPPTGSFSNPGGSPAANSYLGPSGNTGGAFGNGSGTRGASNAPLGQGAFGGNNFAAGGQRFVDGFQSSVAQSSFNSPDPAFQGSGVGLGGQRSGLTETNSTFTNTPNIPRPVSSTTRDPRAGGMQVIDLTGAPNPPGYQPGVYPQQNFPGANFQTPYQQTPNVGLGRGAFQQGSVAGSTTNFRQQVPSTTPNFQPRDNPFAPSTPLAPTGIAGGSNGFNNAIADGSNREATLANEQLHWRRPSQNF